MNFESVLSLLVRNFKEWKIDYALIGGFALSFLGHPRATQDIDFLIEKSALSQLKKLMESLGYRCEFESEDVATFIGQLAGLGRVDFLLAHRLHTQDMLKRVKAINGINVITPEDLIGLKVQSLANNPERYHQDLADIEVLFKDGGLDLDRVREYFRIFKKEAEFDQLRDKIKDVQ
jgi:hypothetical protein